MSEIQETPEHVLRYKYRKPQFSIGDIVVVGKHNDPTVKKQATVLFAAYEWKEDATAGVWRWVYIVSDTVYLHEAKNVVDSLPIICEEGMLTKI